MKLSKTYQPNNYEPNIYAMWETSGAFAPSGKGEPYSIIMPPPNANGNLHVGHALMVVLEDVLVRYNRMKGKDVIWIPGADHAGFETWVVYEKELAKTGKSRFDFSREQLYSQVWNFVDEKRGNMDLQLRALGASPSWDNLVFTLDKKVIDTTYKSFKRLWDEGLIYRGERIINYCTVHQTSFSDIEVIHKNEKGKLWKIAYPSLDQITEIVVATTRPETMLGDVAIAVHPEDERYKSLVGTRVQLPLSDKEIPIIADDYVDPTYGTGAVKVTPFHDPNDFEIGKRHNLESIQVIGFDGKMENVPSQFANITPLEARIKVLAALKAAELLRGEETIEHAVAHCYKCDSIIEPLVKDQWFVHMKPLAERAKQAIENDEISFTPDSKKQALIQYYDSIRDWNLSRQIPWGIPIPAFVNSTDPTDWIFDERVDETQIVVNGTTYNRENDTFDTWFSSGQWPFITTDYLDNGELAKFYPTSVLATGGDILYPWVARMIMLGLKLTDKVPFKHVYLHGLVLDEHGVKMSKSKGNVINPIETLTEYGSDALRMGVMASRSAGQNQAFSSSKVVAGRNFCNKLWNIARYTEDKVGEGYRATPPNPESLADHWILKELATATGKLEELIDSYRFAEASELVYHTVWSSVADWYIEASKRQSNPAMLTYVLETVLKLAHPFAPFVTETIWQTLPGNDGTLLISAAWPDQLPYDDIAAAEFERLQALVTEVRLVTSELPGNHKYTLLFQQDTLVEDNSELICHLANLKEVKKIDQAKGIRLANSGRDAWIEIDEKTLYEHQSNLEVRLAEAHKLANSLEGRLNNKNYTDKAPENLVQETRDQLEQTNSRIERLQREFDVLT